MQTGIFCHPIEELIYPAQFIRRNRRAEQAQSGLPDDLAAEYQAISDWVKRLFDRHGEGVVVKVIDAASLEGVARTLRHGLRRLPAVVVGGRHKFTGTDFRPVDEWIDTRLAPAGKGGEAGAV